MLTRFAWVGSALTLRFYVGLILWFAALIGGLFYVCFVGFIIGLGCLLVVLCFGCVCAVLLPV